MSRRSDQLFEERLRRAAEEFDAAAGGLLDDLEAAGYPRDEVFEYLVNTNDRYDAAIPILLQWLPRIEDESVKEAIVRALTVRWAREDVGTVLIAEWRNASHSLRWVIGNALSEVATDKHADAVRRLAADTSAGTARQMLAAALGRIGDPRSVRALIELLDEDDVAGHAAAALRRHAPPEAREPLERLAGRSSGWVRKEAERALARLPAA